MSIHSIQKIQEKLAEADIDGWLLFDNHGSNRFVRALLEIPIERILTRRFFYWIPKVGEPIKILHTIESGSLDHVPGGERLYLSWDDAEKILRQALKNCRKIWMEYSPRGANPYISVVDGGTIEWVRDLGVEILSSADVMQCLTSVLSEEQITSHLQAASVLQKAIANTWEMLSSTIKKGILITEIDVQNFILKEFESEGCFTEEGPICAVNAHSALPHYAPTPASAQKIQYGDWVLIDLWCKKREFQAIYADITRVAVVAESPAPKQQKIFDIVNKAQKKGIDVICQKVAQNENLKGADVDDVCRDYIVSEGYGPLFTHRTGHNLDTSVHGAGAHLDNFETSDDRQLLPGMCFTIEPGIYIPGEFGVRLETNLLIQHDRHVKVTAGLEEKLICLL